MATLTNTANISLNALTQLIEKEAAEYFSAGADRFIVAVAGPPASGKSSLAQKLCDSLSDASLEFGPIVVPMDGFHLSNSTLKKVGLVDKKGAPNTFDTDGFARLLDKIYDNQTNVKVPEFDRSQDKVIYRGKQVTSKNKIVLVEGNYLLVEDPPWGRLMGYFDMPIMLLPKTDVLEKRLVDRWLAYGCSAQEARDKAFSNDIPNAKYVLANSVYVDLTYEEIL